MTALTGHNDPIDEAFIEWLGYTSVDSNPKTWTALSVNKEMIIFKNGKYYYGDDTSDLVLVRGDLYEKIF